MKILSVVGTRPNFMKIGSLLDEFEKYNIENVLVHTGQHYDEAMSKLFFDDLGLKKPDINLGIGSGSYAEQTGNLIMKLEEVFIKENPDLVIVVGDVNSTLAAALIAKQLGIKVAHVESGLRSFDLDMPEEINRMVVDRLSDYLFTTEKSGNVNLEKEGVSREKIHFVGNVMIDTLLKHKSSAENSTILDKLNLKSDNYCLLTLHRPSNVDIKENFEKIVSVLEKLSEKVTLVLPVHPRTNKNLEKFGLNDKLLNINNIKIIDPVGYLDFLHLMSNAKLVLTDSGGIQEETTVLGVPCITLRENTERPVTVDEGTNLLVTTNGDEIIDKVNEILDNKIELKRKIPELWDGKAGERIVQILTGK